MSASNSVVTPSDIVLTPVRVNFNGVDLGATEGGVTAAVKYDMADILADQFGKTPLNKIVSGQAFTCKLILAESKNKANWKVAFPSAKLLTGNTNVYFDMQIGDDLLSKAKNLILHPLANVDGDKSGDILFYKAAAMNASEVKYGPDKQTGLQVEFIVFPDTSVVPARMIMLGDPANGIVNAMAAAPVAGSNTGNGTITSQAATNAGTKTETITVQCVGIGSASANVFEVSGSVSGILGVFSLAAAATSTHSFVAPGGEISFLATQGSVQFVVGDSFTIATTAANYT